MCFCLGKKVALLWATCVRHVGIVRMISGCQVSPLWDLWVVVAGVSCSSCGLCTKWGRFPQNYLCKTSIAIACLSFFCFNKQWLVQKKGKFTEICTCVYLIGERYDRVGASPKLMVFVINPWLSMNEMQSWTRKVYLEWDVCTRSGQNFT